MQCNSIKHNAFISIKAIRVFNLPHPSAMHPDGTDLMHISLVIYGTNSIVFPNSKYI